ncbi:PBS lyase [Catellatospora chokoriensis]|uniref:PBS lyase n=1 Tax=Catellatospora chokoriensis TaxID=310353 RepID=UPI00178146A7|nr:PBS lyase [Catellatospora chokoriensis]
MTDGGELLAGVDEVRWGRMRHAYGPAVEVPDLLRGLADADPAVRETALDAMYGGIHHQGDVYACTIAVIPFLLRIAADAGRPGRAEVIGLLAGIAGADDPEPRTGLYRQAREAVSGAYPLWCALAHDPDPQVRAAVPAVLPVCAEHAADCAGLLRDRFALEPDVRVRVAIIESAARLARRGADAQGIVGWLADLLAHDEDVQVRLTALTALAPLPAQPGVPPVPVRTALDLLDAVYAQGTPISEPAGFATDTLLGSVRRRQEAAAAGRRAPDAAQLVRAISDGLADRVEDRITLLSALLASPDWECRCDALYPASNLINGWRGSFAQVVALVGEQLHDGHHGLRPRAAHVLEDLGELARPAADALFEGLSRSPRAAHHPTMSGRLPWVVAWAREQPTIGPALKALAGAGDPRALPMLQWALEQRQVPRDVGQLIAPYGAEAGHLLPLLRRRLRRLRSDDRCDNLAYAVGAIGPAAADAVPDLLKLPVSSAVIRAVAAIGPAAAPAMGWLREQAAASERRVAAAAADALYTVGGDAAAALAVYDRFLTGDSYDQRAAAEGLGRLGPHAAERAGRLRKLLRGKDSHGWLRLNAARALWQVAGEASTVMPVLESVWTANPHTRTAIAQVWSGMGAAASAARPLLAAELARVRRHNASPDGYSSSQVVDDEHLLRACRAALAALDG